jgi:tetratricopeptide (TPR) repeat protein
MQTTDPYLHAIGDRLQLMANWEPSTVIGREAGAFGVVYVLEHPSGARTAVKTPRQDIGRQDVAQRVFAEEAAIWCALPEHPSILSAYAVFAHDGRPYVHMEHIAPINEAGASLAALATTVPSGFAPHLNAVLHVAFNVGNGLEHVERQDAVFVHGDIKPQNLLVRRTGPAGDHVGLDGRMLTDTDILVADFGMARAAGATLPLGRAGDLRYFAPEVLEPSLARLAAPAVYGQPDIPVPPVTKAADVYAIGCTLFELLFRQPRQMIAAGPPAQALYACGPDPDPEQLAALRPDLDLALATFLARCLAHDPARRPQDYTSFTAALRAAVHAAGGIDHEYVRHVPLPAAGHEEVDGAPLVAWLVEHSGLDEEAAVDLLLSARRAADLRAMGRLDASDALLDELLERVPGFPLLTGSKGHNAMLRTDMGVAAERFVEALDVYGEDPSLRAADDLGYLGASVNLAQLIVQPHITADVGTALAVLENALADFPGSAKVHATMGMALLRVWRFEEAARALLTAHEIDPASRFVQRLRICCLLVCNHANGDALPDDYPDPGAATEITIADMNERDELQQECHAYMKAYLLEHDLKPDG